MKQGISFSIDPELHALAKEIAWRNRMTFSDLVRQSLLERVSQAYGVKRAKVIAERMGKPGSGKRRASPA